LRGGTLEEILLKGYSLIDTLEGICVRYAKRMLPMVASAAEIYTQYYCREIPCREMSGILIYRLFVFKALYIIRQILYTIYSAGPGRPQYILFERLKTLYIIRQRLYTIF
jgi:hypothetical protein